MFLYSAVIFIGRESSQVKLAGKAATSSLFLIPAGEKYLLAELKGVVCEREGNSEVV